MPDFEALASAGAVPLVTDLQAKGLFGPASPGGHPARPPMDRLLRLTGRQHS